jgi:signal transduction histidine kinase
MDLRAWLNPARQNHPTTFARLPADPAKANQDLLAANGGWLVTDRRGVIWEADAGAAAILRTRADFLAGMPLTFFLVPACWADFYHFLSWAAQEDAAQFETCLRTPGATPRNLALSVTQFHDRPGTGALRWRLHEVAGTRAADTPLLAEQEFNAALVDQMPGLVLLVRPSTGAIRWANAFLTVATGGKGPEVVGQDWCALLLPEEFHAAGRDLVRRAAEAGAATGGSWPLAHGPRPPCVLQWSARRLDRGADGPAVLLFGQDVTELTALRGRAECLEPEAAVGRAFRTLAHHGRNVLQRAQAALTLLEFQLPEQPGALPLLDRLQAAQDELRGLFDGLREFTGPLHLEPQSCHLAGLWRQAWADLAPRRADRAAELIETAGGQDLRCTGSPAHLRQVFCHLFANALDFCPPPILIRLDCTTAEEADRLRVRVTDNGPGFGDRAGEAFEPFRSTKPRGLGLGLAFCRRVIEAHGGRITAAGGGGPGAVIEFTLPRRMP